ncbi:MAG: tandem-95 repeat protein, partial [Planctomycetales bacterium]|nr:tandem-95 repeat protein [Planctomycetales bacterium]
MQLARTNRRSDAYKRIRRSIPKPFEALEDRQLLAGDLVAHWRADSLDATVDDGAVISGWVDSINQVEATQAGEPKLAKAQIGGKSAVQFDTSDGDDGLKLRPQDSPMTGLSDFTVVVAFATDSQSLVGDQGNWFDNTGIVDANALGFSADWGITMNSRGQLSVGLGGGFGITPVTLYSTTEGLNDGQLHTAAFVKQGGTMSLYVDELPADSRSDAPAAAITPSAIGFGQLGTGKNSLTGQIAEVRIYNGALDGGEAANSIAEVSGFYNNSAPVAVADTYSVAEDEFFFVVPAATGVLANDTDAEGDSLTAVLVTSTANGNLRLRDDGSFIYDSNDDFFGDDSFTYVAFDGQSSEPTTVTIHVTNVYDPVTPVAESYQSFPSEPLVVDAENGVLANDLNPDRANLVAELVGNVANGSLTLNADGSFVYDPQGFAGTTSFSYQINDGTNKSASATTTLVLNTPPEITNDSYNVTEDVAANVSAAQGVLQNDSDADGDALTVKLVEGTTNGTLNLNSDGSFTYTPNANYFGDDQFTYLVSDGVDTISGGIAKLIVTSVNDAPVVQSDSFLTLPDKAIDVSAR